MTAGRPTKYNKEVLENAKYYLKNYEEFDDEIPSVVGFGVSFDYPHKTLYDWKKANPEFSHILNQIVKKQEKVLLSKGLSNKFNSNITKLVLGKHGYKDKVDETGERNINIKVESYGDKSSS